MGRLFDVIAEICKTDPVSVWLLNRLRPNGELYRTETLHGKMKKLADGFLACDRVTSSKVANDELLTNYFTISAAAAHFEKKKRVEANTQGIFPRCLI